ncbi:hypothetical protein T492DRAFT_591178 [Pavlovales sp. CCMP2436]|nr:hypothetical protein T492DRAFT_591178 [Pavlovales sp. CCMP2436]
MGGSPYTSGWGLVFFISVAAAVALSCLSCKGDGTGKGGHGPDREFRAFQRTYLAVYYLAMLADWLQGPYVYALYDSYGFSSHDIAVLFVGGFGSSMVFGTFAGAAADRIGRKTCGLLYAVLYILSCMTKHYKDYSMLMLGRVLGGVATSLLFSTFESWLVCEHNARGYDSAWIGDTFSLAYFGNSVAAILAGVLAEMAASAKPLTPSAEGSTVHFGGFTAPFDLSIAVLVLLLGALLILWNENYGGSSSATKASGAPAESLYRALRALARDRAILLLGTCISFFEGSMYVFVFKWTPVLSGGGDERPPYGLIFSTFMVIGGMLKSQLVPEEVRLFIYLFIFQGGGHPPTHTPTHTLIYSTGACVPTHPLTRPRTHRFPQQVRATVYNIFRIPLNLIVLGVLLNSLSQFVAFSVCGSMLAIAAVCMHQLGSMHVRGYSSRSGECILLGSVDDKAETCQL